MQLSRKIRHAFAYYGLRMCIAVFNNVPRKVALALGSGIGWLLWHVCRKDCRHFDDNLQVAYGAKFSARERYAICKRFYINSGKNIADVIRFRDHLPSLLSLVEIEGQEYFDAAHKQGNGVIGITGHIGNFELLAAYIASLGYPIAVIGRKLYEPRIDDIVVANRARAKLTQFYTTDSPKKLFVWLKKNGGLGVLIDTDSNKVRSIPVPLFGHPTNTPVGQTIVCLRTGAPLLPMCCVRLPGEKFKVIIRPPVQVPLVADEEQNVYTLTAASVQELEQMIDTYRDQWIWQHKRWNKECRQ